MNAQKPLVMFLSQPCDAAHLYGHCCLLLAISGIPDTEDRMGSLKSWDGSTCNNDLHLPISVSGFLLHSSKVRSSLNCLLSDLHAP
jgi:hypothetical protein